MTRYELLERWNERDRRYALRFESAQYAERCTPLIRENRVAEALEIGEPELAAFARKWLAPPYVPTLR